VRRLTGYLLAMGLLIGACASPITIDGDAGQLALDQHPGRIVSLSATHTEILYAIDASSSLRPTSPLITPPQPRRLRR